MKTANFWTDQLPGSITALPIDETLPESVDVAIVGSGYTGLNAARVVAKSGANVAVLERYTIGWGASSRNGGIATPGIKQSLKTIWRKYGDEYAHEFWQASLDAIDLIDQIVCEEHIACDWKRTGSFALATKASHLDYYHEFQKWLKEEFSHEVTLVTRDTIQTEIGSDIYFGGLADDYGGGINPAKYVLGLAHAVARYKAHLCEHTEVQRIERLSTGFRVQTSKGTLRATEVLVATNGYTDRLVPRLKPRIFPVGSYIIVTEPLSKERQQMLSPKGRMFYTSKHLLNYFRLTPDGRMLWGGRNNLNTNLDLYDSARQLQKTMHHAFPNLANVPLSHTWTGKLGITFDLMPHIGQVNGVYYALGFGGHGLSIGTYLGTEVGRLLTGEISRSPFAEIPHQTKFFYRNRTWFLPLAAWYYRFLDWKS